MKQLVVYFSRVGENMVQGDLEIIKKGFTEIVAEKISAITGADLFKLEPEDPYPEDYEECVRRARNEDAANAEVPFKHPLANLDEYDTIYLGFPNWYRSYPRIVATFLRRYDFLGKTIMPFCTNEEGAFGIGELELRGQVKGAIIKSGYAVRGHDAENCDDSLKKWLGK